MTVGPEVHVDDVHVCTLLCLHVVLRRISARRNEKPRRDFRGRDAERVERVFQPS